MELKTFGEEDFDPKKWINKAWSASGNAEKEVFVANTVNRLQLYMKQLTNALDETTTQIVTSIPRILQDASSLQLEGVALQQRLTRLGGAVRDVEQQTGSSIESLQRIDRLKSRLENAASALHEADKWSALARELSSALEAGVPTAREDLTALAGRVAAMTCSLEMLTEAPDYESKRLQLETLYNRLEAAITPPLMEALAQMDAERTSTYVEVFAAMSRSVAAQRAWRRAAAGRLAAARGRQAALTHLLSAGAREQVDWLTNVMKCDTPLGELLRLYTDLLLSLEPTPTKVVLDSLKLCATPEEGINQLLDLRAEIDDFIICIKNIVEAPRQNKETLLPATLREFGRAAYAPLRDLLPRYSELLRAQLTAHLDDPTLTQEDLLEQSRAILSVAERCEGWISAARGKAEKIAGAAAYQHFQPAVDHFMAALASMIAGACRQLSGSARGGVLSGAFPAALALAAAADALRDALPTQHTHYDPPDHPLLDVPSFLGDGGARGESTADAALRRAQAAARALAKDILRRPVDVQLEKIPTLSVWSGNDALSTDLPDFALSPQEYITEVGQYLMTLPQHLEMHLSEKHAPWQVLSELCTHTCEAYAQQILNIRDMDALGTRRCLTDIVYLSSVVEDLGGSTTPALQARARDLRAAAGLRPDEAAA